MLLRELREKQNWLYYAANRYLNSEVEDLRLAEAIVHGYRKLPGFLRVPTAPKTIHAPRLKIKDYRNTPYYRTLLKLAKSLEPLASEIKTFLIHGSVATMDFIPGWSDLDTFVIVEADVFRNTRHLSRFRRKIIRLKPLLKEIDPLAHHGFIFSNEENLLAYPEYHMPAAALGYSKAMLGEIDITFHVRDGREEAEKNFYHYYDIFNEIARTGLIKNKPGDPEYQLKWFVAMLLLMPSLYLQAKGIYLYKKFSFDFVRHPFLGRLSRARKNFSQARTILGKNRFHSARQMLEGWHRDIQAYKHSRKFVNHPRKIPLSVYQKAREEFIHELRKNPDILALYEYGSVSAPGISDLDLIVVAKQRLSRPLLRPTGPNIKRVAKGTLMIMPEHIFSRIQLFDAVRLKKVFGKRIRSEKLTTELLKSRDVASVIDWLPERMIRLVAMLHTNPFDVQYALRYLRSFAYSLENAGKLIGWGKYKEFLDTLLAMRRGWKKNYADDLRFLIKQGLCLGYEALNRFTDQYCRGFSGSEGSLKLFKGQEIIFTAWEEKIDPDWCLAYSSPKTARVFVDKRLAAHFGFYARHNSVLAKEMRRKFVLNGPVRITDKRYKNFLEKKMALASENADFLMRNNLQSGLYRFGFYLPKR